jgi:type II secretory pathway pseudopilin PulG
MFGLRYHVASLAAVFVALAVGILLGVAVSGKLTDVADDAELQNLRNDNEQLGQQLDAARADADAATGRSEGSDELFARAYPTLMDGRLEGKNVAVLFLGPADGSVRAEVEGALADADGGAPARVVALDVPVDPADVTAILEGDELLAGYADEGGDLSDLGRELGRQLAEGDDTLWGTLQSELIEEQSGSTSTPIDAAVVVSTWAPPEGADPDEAPDAAAEATASLLRGLVSGLDSLDIPVVGVAAGEDPEQALDAYRDRGISTVDDLDIPAGRLALALLLAGAQPGHYGFGEGATDGSVPPIEPLPVEGE